MGGYFLSNNNKSTKKSISVFGEIGLDKYNTYELGEWQLVYFNKKTDQNSNIINNCYKEDDNLIIGSGFYSYKNKIGYEALSAIYEDIKKIPSKEVYCNVKGHFSFITYINNIIQVISDKSGMYKVYEANENNNKYFSTSFLSICECMDKLSVDKQSALEYINTSVVQGEGSLYKEVNTIPNGTIIDLKNNQTIKYFEYDFSDNTEISDADYYVKHITKYFDFLKGSKLNNICDITAGADSRLLVSILHNLNLDFETYTNANFPDDKEILLSKNIATNENITQTIKVYDIKESFNEKFYKLFNLFDMQRPMIQGYIYGEDDTFDYFSNFSNLLRIRGHAAELTRYFDWVYEDISFDEFFNNMFCSLKIDEKIKSDYIKKLKNKFLKFAPIENMEKLTYKDIFLIYWYTRCLSWAGQRISAENRLYCTFIPFEDITLSLPFFNIDENLIKNNLLIKILLKEYYPEIAKYPSCYKYGFDDFKTPTEMRYIHNNKQEIQGIVHKKPIIKRVLRKLEDLTIGQIKKIFRTKYHNKNKIKNEQLINEKQILQLFRKKPFIIKKIFKSLDIEKQALNIQDNIYCLEILLQRFESKINI